MCAPRCIEHVKARLAEDRLSRRRFFNRAGATAAGAAALGVAPRAPSFAAEPRSFTRAIDLTHPLPLDFPTYFGQRNLEMETLFTWAEHKFNMFRWHLTEHTGTHMDAPIHFSENGESADQIPIEKLVVPLVVVDIRAKAAEDANAQVTPDDLSAWVGEHGPIPDGACVAMNSGWDTRAKDDGFRNADAEGVMHFPGFHVEAAQWLMEGRNVVGIGVDTLSLDHGPSPDFATHYAWLPTNRWGMEAMANLGELPPVGATLVVGGPKIAGATGGPARLIALV